MPRKMRVQYPGAIYHVMNRGDRREVIFLDDFDRRCFLETLCEACEKTLWQVHAYCLMGNHFGEEGHESVEQQALRIIDEELGRLGMSLEELRLRRNGDPAKVGLARLLRRRTTMSLKWVANQLRIDNWKCLSKMLTTQPASNGQLTFAEGFEDAKPTITL